MQVLTASCPAPAEVAAAMAGVGGGRLNFTFRHAPSVLGREDAYACYDAASKTASAACGGSAVAGVAS